MPPVQILIAATTALLFPYCVCEVNTVPTAQAGIFAVANRTGTEAINARWIADDYFQTIFDWTTDKYLNITVTCSDLIDSSLLPYPQNVPSFTSTVNVPRCSCNNSTVMINPMVSVSANLHYLLYMYSHVLGLIYQSNTNHTQQLEQLDLLEMVFYRLSNQIQRYLQAHSLSSGYTKCIVHQEIEETVTALWQEGFTNMEIVNMILCHLREVTKRILDVILEAFGREHITLLVYQFCTSVRHVNC